VRQLLDQQPAGIDEERRRPLAKLVQPPGNTFLPRRQGNLGLLRQKRDSSTNEYSLEHIRLAADSSWCNF
jgi:hypothetical protein